MRAHSMDEEIKYRVEKEDEPETKTTKRKSVFFEPLPESKKAVIGEGKNKAITTLLGITMYERTRDILVLILVPLSVALIDANLYALVVIDVLPDSTIYLFVLPALAAIPIGLTAGKTSHGAIGGIVCTVFFLIFLELFFITPAFMAPDAPFGEFVLAGLWINFVYMFFLVFASLLGSLVGTLLREFF